MDLVPGNAEPILQATVEDLTQLFDDGFGATLVLSRNYGDWLRVEAQPGGAFGLECYEAALGKRLRSDEKLTPSQTRDAAVDYFYGHWNWRQDRTWCDVTNL